MQTYKEMFVRVAPIRKNSGTDVQMCEPVSRIAAKTIRRAWLSSSRSKKVHRLIKERSLVRSNDNVTTRVSHVSCIHGKVNKKSQPTKQHADE